jgi:hypothetical protein
MPGAVKPAAVPGLIEKLTELPRGDAFAPAKFEFDSGALGDKEGLAALGGSAGLAVATAE